MGKPTPEQVARLVAEGWREVPDTFDTLYFKSYMLGEFQESFHRQNIEKAAEMSQTLPGAIKKSEEELKQWVEGELKRIQREYSVPRQVISRMRKRGDIVRWDRTVAKEGEVLTRDTPLEETYLQQSGLVSKQFRGMHVFHHKDRKNVYIFDDAKRGVHMDEPWDFGRFPVGARLLLRLATAMQQNDPGTNLPRPVAGATMMDPARIEALVAGKNDSLVITVDEETISGIPCDLIGIWLPTVKSPTPVIVIACQKSDYSVTPWAAAYEPHGGKLANTVEASEFKTENSFTFPTVVTTTAYNVQTNERKVENIIIEYMRSPAEIPDEVMEFKPPDGYFATDFRPDTPVAYISGAPPSAPSVSPRRFPIFIVIANLVVFGGAIAILRFRRERRNDRSKSR